MSPPHAGNAAGTLVSLSALLACSLAVQSARAGDPYDDALALSRSRETSGDLRGAIAALEAIARDYPQDYDLPLRLGWLHFQTGKYELAAGAYATAVTRSPGAADALAGLGWSLARLGRCSEANGHFRRARETVPDHRAATRGLAFCASTPGVEPSGGARPSPGWSFWPRAAFTAAFFPEHAYRTQAFGGTASIDASHASGWTLGATYRHTRSSATEESGVEEWGQHDAFLRAGYSSPLFGLQLTYGLLHDETGVMGTSHHAGLSARWSPLGDVVIDASVGAYEDTTIVRIAPSWRIPIEGGLSVRPGFAIQSAGGQMQGSIHATAFWQSDRLGLFAGGKYGAELRPSYLSLGLVDSYVEAVRWGAWVGGSVNIGDGHRIELSYSTSRLADQAGAETQMHAVTLGASGHF